MANEHSNDVNRVTPRQVEPDSRSPSGAPTRRSKADDKSTGRLRDGDNTVEADGGDQAGVAGGSVDSNVSGRGGDRR
jgi:hypothetical protein